MTWNLVEALTGMETGDDWNNNGRGSEVVTVKTHYPQSNGILPDFDDRIHRAFIVIRNPLESIPSFFNHIYEMRNHLPVHSERAPVQEWVKWRNAYVDIEIAEYKKFVFYWMDRYTPENRHLLTYEGLTDDLIGAEVTKGLNEFLGQVEGVDPIDQDSVACVWKAVVKNQPPAEQAAQIAKLQALALNKPQSEQGPPYSPPEPQQPALRQNAMNQPQSEQGPPEPQQPELRQNALNQLQSEQGPSYSQPEPQQPELSQTSLNQPQSEQDPSHSQPEPQQPALRQNALNQPLSEQGPPYSQLEQQQPALRRRLDPGHHDSQRKGPAVPRPYTPQQLDSMMNMLLEIGERYKTEDVRLYHIMMGYYEKVREARIKTTPDESVEPPPGGYF